MHQMLTQLKLARIREIHQEWLDRAAETQMLNRAGFPGGPIA